MGIVFRWLSTFISASVSVGSVCGAVAILVLTGVMTREVVGRLLGSPWLYTFDVSNSLLVLAAFLGLAYTAKQGRHVRVTFIFDRLPPKWQSLISCGTTLIALVLTTVLFYQGVLLVQWSHQLGRTTESVIPIPLFAIQILVPLGAGLLWLQLVVRFLSLFRRSA